MRGRLKGAIGMMDWPGLFLALALITFGVVIIHCATAGTKMALLGVRQDIYGVSAFALLFIALLISYEIWIEYSAILYGVCILVLVVMPFAGHAVAGSRSWLSLGGYSMQPSEVAKVLAALACAAYIKDLAGRKMERRDIAILSGIIGLPMFLTAAQPDFGTATTFLPLFVAVLFMSPLDLSKLAKWAALGFVSVAVLFALGWFTFFKPYQKERVLTFLDPSLDPKGAGYQVMQAKIAVGSGQITGKGLYSGTQSRLNFLPAPYTDFVFGVVCEETGFIGAGLLLSLYVALLLRVVSAMELAKDAEGRFLAAAAFFTLLYHILINTGMVVGLLPTTGIPLPFLSYGGSALFSMTMLVAMALNVRMRRYSV